MARLWVGIWPPDWVVERLSELHRKDQVGARFVPPQNWHVTLRFLGDADPSAVDVALRSADLRAASVRLGPAVDLLGEKMLVLPAAGVDDLAASVVGATRVLGTEPIRRRFVGHLTLARLKRRANMPRALGELFSAEWRVDSVALVESTLRPDGARYETLAEYPTSGE
ncbi:MAG: RNA 2',3'-cyclic phosphodiesterase [Actinomycetota bacterium]